MYARRLRPLLGDRFIIILFYDANRFYPILFENSERGARQDAASAALRSPPRGWTGKMPETGDCPNGLCARKPTGAAADSYGNRPAGQTATAVFALG